MATNRKVVKAAAKPASAAASTPAPVRRTIVTQAVIAGQKPTDPGPVESGEKVTAMVPKHLTITLDDHTEVKYKPGVQDMPVEHARHWWATQNGVTIHGDDEEQD